MIGTVVTSPRLPGRLTLATLGGALLLAGGATARERQPDPAFLPSYAEPVGTPATPANGSIFQVSAGYASLVEGQAARRVGDVLTIVLVERTVGSKAASSNLDRDGSYGLRPPTVGPLALFSAAEARVGAGGEFEGAGTAGQSNTLSGEVSVTVARVFPNGTMLVRGQKTVTLNRGDEYVQISGLVRTADIDPDNRVLSTRVADARIKYTGTGDVARSSRQGWLSRFFQVVSPF